VPGGLAQEDGGGPDLDPGHGGQDLVKKVACTRVSTLNAVSLGTGPR